jgi:hypothetical protein
MEVLFMNFKLKHLALGAFIFIMPALSADDQTKTDYVQKVWSGLKCLIGTQAAISAVRSPIGYAFGLSSLINLSEYLTKLSPQKPSRFQWIFKAASFPFMLVHSYSAATIAARTTQVGAAGYTAYNLSKAEYTASERVSLA